MNLIDRLGMAGIYQGMDISVGKKIKITNQISMTLAVIAVCYIILFCGLGYLVQGFSLAPAVLLLAGCVYLNYRRRYLLARLLCFGTVFCAVFIYAILFGSGSGIVLVFLPCICLPWIFFSARQSLAIHALTLISVAGFFTYYCNYDQPLLKVSAGTEKIIYCCIIVTIFIYIYVSMKFMSVQNDKAEKYLSEMYQNFFEDIPTPMWIQDATSGAFLAVNRRAIDSYGFSMQEFRNMRVSDISATMPSLDSQIADVENNGYAVHRRKNGDLFYAHVLTNHTTYKNVAALVVQAIDVNEKVVTEKHLAELKISQQKLKTQGDELEKTNKELDSFVYRVSHDLRAPLSSMLGIIDLCEAETQDDVTHGYNTMIRKCVAKMDGFIVDILDYSRNTRLGLAHDEIDFHQLTTDIGDGLRYMDKTTGQNIDIRMCVNQERIFHSDKKRLLVVLSNLVSNAIRYRDVAKPDPFVSVNVQVNSQNAQISVKDNGIGIEEEYHDRIFDMFFRLSSNSAGTGLGLYIVRETIVKLQGNINVVSTPGVGTEFIIEIPDLDAPAVEN